MTKSSNSDSQKELEKAIKTFDAFDASVKEMTLDRMNMAPKEDVEPQTKLSAKEIEKSDDLYLKPTKKIQGSGKFNEKFREDFNYAKEYVHFMAENRELIGEKIEKWTRPFPGQDCEFWEVPTNKPVWGPRYLAEEIKKCAYHRLVMQESRMTHTTGAGQFYGAMAADTIIQRLDAIPVSSRKSVFMGATKF